MNKSRISIFCAINWSWLVDMAYCLKPYLLCLLKWHVALKVIYCVWLKFLLWRSFCFLQCHSLLQSEIYGMHSVKSKSYFSQRIARCKYMNELIYWPNFLCPMTIKILKLQINNLFELAILLQRIYCSIKFFMRIIDLRHIHDFQRYRVYYKM